MLLVQRLILRLANPIVITLVLLVGAAGLARRDRRRGARGLALAAALFLYLSSLPLVSARLMGSLERPGSPSASIPSGPLDVLVLTGGVHHYAGDDRPPVPTTASLRRIVAAVTLARKDPGSRLIVSGGRGDPMAPPPSEGRVLADLALDLGMPGDRLVVEETSRTTWTSPASVAPLLRGTDVPVVLVTSAHHMMRAVDAYRSHGLDVTEVSTDFRSFRSGSLGTDLIPQATCLDDTALFMREGLSRVHQTLFRSRPAPSPAGG